MERVEKLDKKLLLLCFFLFAWFFAANLYTAFTKAPIQDDAMFSTVAKNIVTGYGWATSYGEKIPFNPDLTAGPSLLLPTAGMIAAFGPQTWTPAITGALLNILLTALILWQLQQLVKNRTAHFFAMLLAMLFYAPHDFRTLTGYYASSQLFLFSLFFVLNKKYSLATRLIVFGVSAAIGCLAKPLILLSFMIATPLVLLISLKEKNSLYSLLKNLFILLIPFLMIVSSWNLYQNYQLSKLDVKTQAAHAEYKKFFFTHHGTGIAQFNSAKNKLDYFYKNTAKNYRILRNFLIREYNAPLYALILFLTAPIFFLRKNIFKDESSFELRFFTVLSLVTFFHFLWFVLVSFSMTPGHAYFPARYGFILFFFALASMPNKKSVAIILCLSGSLLFPIRHTPLLESLQFTTKDLYLTNKDIKEALDFIKSHPAKFPLASCSYQAAPWRLELMLEGSHHFLDCFNLLEDALTKNEQGNYHWNSEPNFTLVLEGLNLFLSGKERQYLLDPLARACQNNIVYRNDFYAICHIYFSEIKDALEPDKTAQQLTQYQFWYRTRLKTNQ